MREANAEQEAVDRCRELVADWMIENGFATGHGDTIQDLLAELRVQIKERVLRSLGSRP